jgi:hypothetical protein
MPNLEVGRLVAVAGGVVLVLIVLVLLLRSCGGDSTASQNEDYTDQVTAALKKSDQASTVIQELFRSAQPVKLAEARQRVGQAQDLEEQALAAARAIEPTDEAAPYHAALIQTISYRINALKCMDQALPQAYKAGKATAGGALLTPCTQRLMASDVIYADSYAGAVNAALADAEVEARVPTSVFLPPALQSTVTPAGMGLILQRIKPGSGGQGGGGLHGLSLDSVIARSGGKNVTLLPGGDINTVTATTDLVFVVSATNGGNFQEFDIPVVLKLGSGQDAPTAQGTIDQIGPGDTATVEITGLTSDSTALDFGQEVNLHVTVQPVPGEKNSSNNRATYTIAFTLAE